MLPCDILIQGSTSLGVSFKDSDVDAVLITPNFVFREDFFTSFVVVLRQCSCVSDLLVISDSIVPLIKMKFETTSVDLVMSRFNLPSVPSYITFDMDPERFYFNIDQYSVHGLSGCHFAEKIRTLVPNMPVFLELLKIIKVWAHRRQISHNVYGFPSNIGWVIMCAYLCIHLGKGCDMESVPLIFLVKMFFNYFANWQWPSPVTIAPFYTTRELKLYSWEPKLVPQDTMPIITPVYPHQNASYLVRPSTLEMVVNELKRGGEILTDITLGKACWEDLFAPYEIVEGYKHFLKFELSLNTFEELKRIGGLVDSRLRELAALLEGDKDIQAVRIAKYQQPRRVLVVSESPSKLNEERYKFERSWLLGLQINRILPTENDSKKEQIIDITNYIQMFYLNLQDRESHVNFIEILKPSYVKQLKRPDC
ncbi:unnamed protein product [Rodentolepis nana]|uniref:polynucleotide adenylyltransferase n=1 Tax=Rodentolepis nana TaxID=102285 RepID=A0A158QHD0_RODNA|nr:unnamed protein product [Rodentolepis nana]